jgi:hypothetical protein
MKDSNASQWTSVNRRVCIVKVEDSSNQRVARSKSGGRQGIENADRRGHPRYPVSASAEVLEPRTHTRITGRATDLGLGGCYVDTLSPFPVGTSVHMRMFTERHSFQTQATVSYALTSMGMGLAFIKIAPDQAAVMREWVAELSGEVTPGVDFDSDRHFPQEKPAGKTSNLRDIVHEMVGLLERKQVISEIEAAALRAKLSE